VPTPATIVSIAVSVAAATAG
ncbi:hypothetical protein Tco_0935516, partial [Tanacetum coccineum]